MADITDQTSPADIDDAQSVGNGAENRGVKRQRSAAADDDDDDDDKGGRERRKIEIKFISDKSRRHITFSKRKAGIMKKVRCVFPFCSAASTISRGDLRIARGVVSIKDVIKLCAEIQFIFPSMLTRLPL